MKTKQTIAVIGSTDSIGSAIYKNLSQGNYRILLCPNEQSKMQDFCEEIKATNALADVEEMDCDVQATWEADIVILAFPFEEVKEAAEKIREMANQKIVISISKSLDVNVVGQIQELLPNSKVVKVFGATFATESSSLIADEKPDVCLAGNDEEALQTVAELVATAGFSPIISGSLSLNRI